MKLVGFIAALSLSLANLALVAQPIPADSRITDVAVYSDRAQVTRTVNVSLGAGENRIVFGDLTAALADDSVRATGKAATTVSIEDVEVRTIVRPQIDDQAAAELERQLQKLRDENAALDARQRVLDQQRSFLSQIQVKAAGDISRDVQINKLDLAQLKELPAFLGDEYAKIEDEAQKIVLARRELEPKIQAAEAEFGKRRTAMTRATKFVIVSVNAKEATTLQLRVSYVLGGASWTPSYDARAEVDGGRVEFTYNGLVRQQTGEDWRGVNLTLSTARPAIGARMPELGKWMVDFPQSVPPVRMEVMRKSEGEAQADRFKLPQSTVNVTAVPVAATPLQAEVEQGVTSASFHVPRVADVPSDGELHRQTVSVLPLGASFSYAATPKLSSFAYLKASVTNTTDAPLLGGTVNVFVGADFMGAGWIGTVPQMAKFDLFLGVDEGIHVKREELKEKRGKSGIFNKRSHHVYAYKITVENYKNSPQTVTVYEPIPVSANDDIKVTLSDASTKPSEQDAATGKLTWEMILKSHEKREIVYEFTVDWPQDKQVAGL